MVDIKIYDFPKLNDAILTEAHNQNIDLRFSNPVLTRQIRKLLRSKFKIRGKVKVYIPYDVPWLVLEVDEKTHTWIVLKWA